MYPLNFVDSETVVRVVVGSIAGNVDTVVASVAVVIVVGIADIVVLIAVVPLLELNYKMPCWN